MSNYAELNTDNLVINIIVADQEFIETQTNKNYVEYDDANSASIGDTYDPISNTFIPPYVEPVEPIEPIDEP